MGFDPGTSRTQSENSTITPTRHYLKTTHYLKKALTEGNDSVTGIRFEDHDIMMIGDKRYTLLHKIYDIH